MSQRAQRCALLASIVASGVVFLDSTIVNVALPAIRSSLHGTLAVQQWVVEAYLLTLASLLLVGGSLGDLLGRRRVLAAGLAGFGACSIGCAVAPSAGILIGARTLQGVAGALLVPGSLALIMDTHDEGERSGAIGSWTAWTGIMTVAGPLGGGLLIQAASWRWVFAINPVPIALALWLLPRTGTDRSERGHVDLGGAALCALGLAGPVFGLIEQPHYGWADPRVAVPLGAGVALLLAFLVHERRSPAPMLPLHLFSARNFSVGNLTTFTLYGGLGVATFLLVVFLQQVQGYTPLAAGAALLPITILLFALSRRLGVLAGRVGPRLFMGVGPLLAGGGLLLLMALTRPGAPYATGVLPGVIAFGLGLALTVAPLTAAVLGAAPAEHSGLASGVNNAVARVGSLLAIAAVGAVVSAAFAGRVHDPRAQPLVVRAPGLSAHQRATRIDASIHAFRIGIGAAGFLAVVGGLISLAGIENSAAVGRGLRRPWRSARPTP